MNDDLRNALEQLRCRASGGWEPLHLLPGEAQALLDEREVLQTACKAAMELIPLIEQGMGSAHPERQQRERLIHAAIAKTRNEEA